MKKYALLAFVLFALPAFAKNAKKDDLKLIDVPQLQKLMTTEKPMIFDANNAETRKDKGTIPGAIELPSANNYDLALLKTDKNKSLVFYCANEMCMASHDAAKRAIKAGFKHVAVLSPGIEGWNRDTKTKTN